VTSVGKREMARGRREVGGYFKVNIMIMIILSFNLQPGT